MLGSTGPPFEGHVDREKGQRLPCPSRGLAFMMEGSTTRQDPGLESGSLSSEWSKVMVLGQLTYTMPWVSGTQVAYKCRARRAPLVYMLSTWRKPRPPTFGLRRRERDPVPTGFVDERATSVTTWTTAVPVSSAVAW